MTNATIRPKLLQAACGLGLLWWLVVVGWNLGLLLNGERLKLAPAVPSIGAGFLVFQLFFLHAIWSMQRWGVYAYVLWLIVYAGVTYGLRDNQFWLGLAVPGIVAGVALRYHRLMPATPASTTDLSAH